MREAERLLSSVSSYLIHTGRGAGARNKYLAENCSEEEGKRIRRLEKKEKCHRPTKSVVFVSGSVHERGGQLKRRNNVINGVPQIESAVTVTTVLREDVVVGVVVVVVEGVVEGVGVAQRFNTGVTVS